MNTVSVKTVAFNGGKYKIWSVGGVVTIAKNCANGRFIGKVLASNALWANRNNACLSVQNAVTVNNGTRELEMESNDYTFAAVFVFALGLLLGLLPVIFNW